jgi:hypothetical protein
MTNDMQVRHSRRRTSPGVRLLAAVTGSSMTFLAVLGLAQPVHAGDGTLEHQKDSLFHRKGFVYPEIHQPKKKLGIGTANRVASRTQDVPSSSSSPPAKKSVTGGSGRINWAASSRCVPARLRNAIHYVARNFGRVRVNSTCRSRSRNRRVGGASSSYHLKSQAADLRVFGNIRAAARYLRNVAGGYKHHGGGLFHIDTGPKRT